MKISKNINGLILMAALITFPFINSFSQVTGNAFLSGQTSHSGIKVKFIPNSPTAHLDSTFTSSNGSYSINLAGGLYQVLLSKIGYQNTYLNSGNAFPITTSSTLNSITLLPGNTVIVNGNVSGNWTPNNTYIVNGDITIPANATLDIAPGTIIKFNGDYSLFAIGRITAKGTNAAPITFTSNQASPVAGDWNKIELKNSVSTFDNCLIEYCKTGLSFYGFSATVTNNTIRNCSNDGILAIGGNSLISGNTIYNYYQWGIFAGGSPSNSIVSCNTIFNGGRYGIITNSNDIVRNNTIYNITEPDAKGISVHAAGSPLIENNFIRNCKVGINVGQNVTPIPNPLIVNNTIINNSFSGILFNEFYANGRVINNIIGNNGYGILQIPGGCSICTTTPDIIAYNLVWNNASGNYQTVQKTGIGQIVTTNSNGDPIDSYFNLSKDPQFISTNSPAVSTNSPALNAGDPAYSVNIGASALLNCQQNALSILENNKSENLAIKSFPNPFTEMFTLNYSVPVAAQVNIEIFDLTGKSMGLVLNEFKPQGEYQLNYDGRMLRPGMYILKLTSKDLKTIHQIIVKH